MLVTLFQSFFRYFGYLSGALFLCSFFIKANITSPWWFPSFCMSALCYLGFTADKLSVHDYYFLPVFPALFVLAGERFEAALHRFSNSKNLCFLVPACLLFSFLLCWPKFFKAAKPNSDVLECATLVKSHVPEGTYIATWSDVSRYNSLAYFSERLALHVEERAFPLTRYKQTSADYLVLNLPVESASSALRWISSQGAEQRDLKEMFDAKKRARICAVFRLGG